MAGINAAVVGILAAALYNPVWTSAVKTPGDFGLALLGFVLLTVWLWPGASVNSALTGDGLVGLNMSHAVTDSRQTARTR